MPYNSKIHHRRSIRLKDYDYRQPGAYFITLCTKKRQCLFGDIVDGTMHLNALGSIAFTCWQNIPQHFPHVELDAFVIMPNHLHGILIITDTFVRALQCNAPTPTQHHDPAPAQYDAAVPRQFGKMVPGSIPTIVRSYKSAVTKQINASCRVRGSSIWQRNYYEHIDRGGQSLDFLRQYIVENPGRWADDPEYPSRKPEIFFDLPF